jgi:hypothetical protein
MWWKIILLNKNLGKSFNMLTSKSDILCLGYMAMLNMVVPCWMQIRISKESEDSLSMAILMVVAPPRLCSGNAARLQWSRLDGES